MLTPNVARFLRNARADASLAEQVRRSDTYEETIGAALLDRWPKV
jgi:hypothetical protein